MRAETKKQVIIILIFAAFLVLLAAIPTGFEKQIYFNSEGVKAKVIETDNSGVYTTGLMKQGDQRCTIEVLKGSYKGEVTEAVNMLTGKMEFDKIFAPGDYAYVLLERGEDGSIIFANMIDHYRIDSEIALVCMFAAMLILFSGFTGVRTIISFAFALLSIWKLLIPMMLKGVSPLVVGLLIGNLITVVTLILVAGFTKKAACAISGSVVSSLLTCAIAVIWVNIFKTGGTVMAWSESLLYAGFEHLNLTAIFQTGIYLACSGAILDLSVDISAALDEIYQNNKDISLKAMIKSGFTIGKAVVGTQTTTLLLAYMGSFITVMMVYMAQGTPFMAILNSKSIAAEIITTFAGCMGIIIVSPLTAVICGFVYCHRERKAA